MTERSSLSRRDFCKRAVAAGGAAALSACLDREAADVPTGPDDPSTLPERQHAWNAHLPTDDHGNDVQPRHRVFLNLEFAPPDAADAATATPTEAHRATVERALRGVERAYDRSADGLFVSLSYSPAYFERFEAGGPAGLDLPAPEALAPFEDPALDEPDALLHLASNHAQVVLGAEAALTGEQDTVNGVDQPDAALTDVFAAEEERRRTGFVGAGLPAEHDDVAGVPEDAVDEDAPLFMGFKSGFRQNQATEDAVTIQSGPFAGGTTQHLSMIRLNLTQWYEQDDRWQREAKMFCPHHAEADAIEGVGENLGDGSAIGDCGPTDETARQMGVVGHSQKTARARDEDDDPLVLRRDVDTTGDGHAGLHFLSLQRSIEDFVATREAMNGTDVAENSAVGQRQNNGILQYVRTKRRGNFLLPPRGLRALPPATPEGTNGA